MVGACRKQVRNIKTHYLGGELRISIELEMAAVQEGRRKLPDGNHTPVSQVPVTRPQARM